MNAFRPVGFRCHDCQHVFYVEVPSKTKCPACKHEYDFEFLTFRHVEGRHNSTVKMREHIGEVLGKLAQQTQVKIKDYTAKDLLPFNDELKWLKTHQGRTTEEVARRVRMIIIMRESLSLSFTQIGDRLDRDHSSVIHLYNKYRKGHLSLSKYTRVE